jgi:hypothetical protein
MHRSGCLGTKVTSRLMPLALASRSSEGFNRETFIVAPGAAPAPKVFPDDATTNPATPPVQLYHLGLWFNAPADAAKAGCPATVTPFNGEHNAGIQVLNTSNFQDGAGPLSALQ